MACDTSSSRSTSYDRDLSQCSTAARACWRCLDRAGGGNDPTLAFVMGGAVLVMAVAWRIRARMAKPLFGEKFSLPDRGDLDPQLLVGSALFGIGWGIAGLCPGPAIASLALSPGAALPFVAAMFAGMAIHRVWPAHHPQLKTRSVS